MYQDALCPFLNGFSHMLYQDIYLDIKTILQQRPLISRKTPLYTYEVQTIKTTAEYLRPHCPADEIYKMQLISTFT
jgi:hypothetical protein